MTITVPNPNRTSITERAQEILDGPAESKLPKLYVAVTHVTRHFGGPEEGGWWYDHTSIEDVRRVFGSEGVIAALEKLDREYPEPRYNRHSVLGAAGDYEFTVCADQDDFPEETTERPRYE